jgi:23S rRNA pseudoU1915 N3-methylase RlmH
MRNESFHAFRFSLLPRLLAMGAALTSSMVAQSPDLQQKVAEVKEAAAKNKQALAQYTWVEQDTISLKGEQKKQEHFQVRLGSDGKPQKTSMDPPAQPTAQSGGGRNGRLKEHVVEKKKEEYKDYADQIKALIQQYLPPDKDAIEQARQKGNVSLGPAETSGQYKLVISNYIKQGDNMTLAMDKTQKNIVSLSIASYLDDPKDAVNVNVQFSQIPGGPNHVSSETINGVSKQLTIAVQNSNYQKI